MCVLCNLEYHVIYVYLIFRQGSRSRISYSWFKQTLEVKRKYESMNCWEIWPMFLSIVYFQTPIIPNNLPTLIHPTIQIITIIKLHKWNVFVNSNIFECVDEQHPSKAGLVFPACFFVPSTMAPVWKLAVVGLWPQIGQNHFFRWQSCRYGFARWWIWWVEKKPFGKYSYII